MKRLISTMLALCMLFAVAACGGSGNDNGGSSPQPSGSGAQATGGDATGDTGSAPPAGSRDTMVIALDADITTLHPSDYASSNERFVNDQIYDNLMSAPVEGGMEFEPRLAESWEVSEDGKSYTFKLRQDVKFHDGSPFTAEDVKFSAELYQASQYQGALVDGLESIEVLDEYTVVMHTNEVFAPFLENIATISIASKAYHESASEDDFAKKPVGTGPYTFVEHKLGSEIALKSNEEYFRGAPAIKTLTYRVLADDTTVAVSLQTGEIDFAKIKESTVANLEGTDVSIMKVPESRFGFISMNHEKEPFSNPVFRQAVAYAIDRQNLIDTAKDGIGTVNSNIISPLRFGYSDNLPEYGYDPEKAKALLADAGITTPYDLGVMKVAEQYKTEAQVIQSDLEAVGLNVTLEIVEFNALLQELFNGDIGITVMAMALEGTTQQYSLALTSPYVGMANNVRYSNKEIDELFDKASHTLDESERAAIYEEIFTKVQEEAVFAVLYNTECLYAHSKDLHVPELPLEGLYEVYDFYWTV